MATLDNIVNQLDEFEIEFKVLNENVRHIFDKNNTLIGQGRDILREIRRISNRRQPAVAAAGGMIGNGNGGLHDIGEKLDRIVELLDKKKQNSNHSSSVKTWDDERERRQKLTTAKEDIQDSFKSAWKQFFSKDKPYYVDDKGDKELKIAAINKIAGSITGWMAVAESAISTFTNVVNIEFQKTWAAFDTTGKIIGIKMDLLANSLNKTLGTVIGGVFKEDLVTVAYEAYDNMLELTKQNLAARLDIAQNIRKYELEIYKLNSQEIQAIGKGVSAMSSQIGSVFGPVGQAVGKIASGAISLGMSIAAAYRNMSEKEQETFIKAMDLMNDAQKKLYETAEETVKIIKTTSQDVSKMLLNIDKDARKIGMGMGYTGANLDNFVKKQLADAASESISQYGKTAEDLIKMQSAYAAASERNVLLTAGEEEGILSAEFATGIDAEEIAKMLGEMHKYNIAVGEGADLFSDMYNTATKLGVNANKMAQNLANNIKLASKVNFKDGVQSIKEMTAWSMKTRFNMESISGMVDKIVSGGIEDIISSSAQLNVLGGNAAMYSDPLGMLYGAIDAQDLAERLNKSIEGLGTYNKETGDTIFNLYDRQIMQRIAAAYGTSSEDLDIMIRTQKQRSDVAGRLSGKGFTEEQIDLINANAKFNKELNEWQVSTVGSGGVTETKSITQLGKDDLDKLINKDSDKALVQYAAENLSEATKQTAAILNVRNILADSVYGDFRNASVEQIAAWNSFFEDNQEALGKAVVNEMYMAVDSQKAFLDAAKETLKDGGVYWEFSKAVRSQFGELALSAAELSIQFKQLNESVAAGNWYGVTRALKIDKEKPIQDALPAFNKANEKKSLQQKRSEETSSQIASMSKANLSIHSMRDAVVQFHKDDEILAGKKDGGLYAMIEQTYKAVTQFPKNSVNSGNSVRGMFGAVQQQSIPQNVSRQSIPWKGELTVKLESKDGKTDITNLVRNTEGMRTLMDSLMKTLAKETSGFGVTSDMILKNYRG